jgi:cytochrome P450
MGAVVTSTNGNVYYDHYDTEIGADPHPIFRRMRNEAPLYHNEERDFYALSRYDDVERALLDRETFISGRGVTLEFIQSGMEIPSGTVIFEDPPSHTIHRALLSRMFTPRKVSALEPEIRQFCADILDDQRVSGGFDFITDLGLQVPMRVIGMLLGVPWDEQEAVRDHFARAGARAQNKEEDEPHGLLDGQVFARYVDWRIEHPSDDVMTELLYADFDDETGTRRRLTRDELLMYINILAAAGNETTGRLIGWAGKLLADHSEQRRQLVEDPSLIPSAIEEILRYEPPALQTCRYVARDTEHYGEAVPAGSAMLLLLASANRDERHYADPDRFDIHRKAQHLSFAFGPHYCLGAAIARLEAQVVLEEVLARFPDWEVDTDNAKLAVTPTFRGWETLPVVTS